MSHIPVEDLSSPRSPDRYPPGAGEKLYSDCLALFSAISQRKSLLRTRNVDEEVFEEGLATLYLWGEGFSNGKLDVILATSPDLCATILKFLAAVGDVLANSE